LFDLRPVGGEKASFFGGSNFGKSLEKLLDTKWALGSLLEVRISGSEVYNNGYGRATIIYQIGNAVNTAYFVGKMAASLLSEGKEKTYNPCELYTSVVSEVVFLPPFFRRLHDLNKSDVPYDFVPTDADLEIEELELQKEKRAQYLGLTPSSRFLNIAVENQVTWPDKETVVNFEGHKIVLLPKTREHTTSIHIDLHGQKISVVDAKTLFNRFLSHLTWIDDQFAVLQDGWSGNPVPVPVPRRDLAFTTAYDWFLRGDFPNSEDARKALAIYREGRNAQQNFQVSTAVLSFYKIIELKHKGKSDAKKWFKENYPLVVENKNYASNIDQFEKIRGTENAHDYLYRACRVAVAHANKPFSTDPDNAHELRRLYVAADILRALSRIFIQKELGVDSLFR